MKSKVGELIQNRFSHITMAGKDALDIDAAVADIVAIAKDKVKNRKWEELQEEVVELTSMLARTHLAHQLILERILLLRGIYDDKHFKGNKRAVIRQWLGDIRKVLEAL